MPVRFGATILQVVPFPLVRDDFAFVESLGLDNAWAAHVIAAVGNYGEIYDRDLGDQSPLKLPRALNRLYTQGGLMYALPLK